MLLVENLNGTNPRYLNKRRRCLHEHPWSVAFLVKPFFHVKSNLTDAEKDVGEPPTERLYTSLMKLRANSKCHKGFYSQILRELLERKE